MSARLVFQEGNPALSEVPLQGTVRFGRDAGSDVELPESAAPVPGVYASIRESGGRYTLRDEGSKRGTFVNRHRVAEHALHEGDLVEFGLDGLCARFETHEGSPNTSASSRGERRGFFARLLSALLGRS